VHEETMPGAAGGAQLLCELAASNPPGDPLKQNRNSSTPPVEAFTC
jgi:hypothetical protein